MNTYVHCSDSEINTKPMFVPDTDLMKMSLMWLPAMWHQSLRNTFVMSCHFCINAVVSRKTEFLFVYLIVLGWLSNAYSQDAVSDPKIYFRPPSFLIWDNFEWWDWEIILWRTKWDFWQQIILNILKLHDTNPWIFDTSLLRTLKICFVGMKI